MEVLVAMVIIVMGISLFILLFITITNSDKQKKLIQAKMKANEISAESRVNHRFLDEKFQQDGMEFYKSVMNYQESDKLQLLMIQVSDTNGTMLYQHQELILAK